MKICGNCSLAGTDSCKTCSNYPYSIHLVNDWIVSSVKSESEFVTWLLDEIWDEEQWKLNWQAFPELLCRKLVTLGYLREKDGEYERLAR